MFLITPHWEIRNKYELNEKAAAIRQAWDKKNLIRQATKYRGSTGQATMPIF
jgi:hypothetical protein